MHRQNSSTFNLVNAGKQTKEKLCGDQELIKQTSQVSHCRYNRKDLSDTYQFESNNGLFMVGYSTMEVAELIHQKTSNNHLVGG